MSNTDKNNATEKDVMVEIGPIPYDVNDRANKYLYISVNGTTIMLERGMKHKVKKMFADAYEHRMAMAGRQIAEREKKDRALRDKQNQEGVSFM